MVRNSEDDGQDETLGKLSLEATKGDIPNNVYLREIVKIEKNGGYSLERISIPTKLVYILAGILINTTILYEPLAATWRSLIGYVSKMYGN